MIFFELFQSAYSGASDKPDESTIREFQILAITESGKKIKCSVDVSNVGNFDGKEVVQLYVHDVIGTYMRPIRELKDYRKVLLKSGEQKTISFELGYDELGYYKPTGEYFVEAGEFEIFIGTDCMAKDKIKLQVVQ